MYEPTSLDAPPKRGMSTGAKIGIGCGVTALLLILICGGLAWYGYNYFIKQAEAFVSDFESKGYVRTSAQVVDVNQPLSQSTVYFAQVVRVNANVDGNLAFAVQVAEINSTVNGDIDFFGQALKINKGAVVTGDVRVKGAQVVDIQGTVQGQVSGSYPGAPAPKQPAQPTPPPPADTAPPATPDAPSAPPAASPG
jgi:hypothetical protein